MVSFQRPSSFRQPWAAPIRRHRQHVDLRIRHREEVTISKFDPYWHLHRRSHQSVHRIPVDATLRIRPRHRFH